VYQAAVFGLTLERSQLYDRINRRVEAMLAAGLEQETRHPAYRQGLSPTQLLSMRSIGYRQMAQYLAGELDYADTMVAKLKQATRHFAKRQFTWYKKDAVYPLVRCSQSSRHQEQIVEIMCQLLVEKLQSVVKFIRESGSMYL
jgi:tRNA dimethylallyltransferase